MSAAGALKKPSTPAAALCKDCGAPLCADEVGLTKKLINRGATEYMCMDCLAAFFRCDKALLHQKIQQFRRQGCVLFSPLPGEKP